MCLDLATRPRNAGIEPPLETPTALPHTKGYRIGKARSAEGLGECAGAFRFSGVALQPPPVDVPVVVPPDLRLKDGEGPVGLARVQ